MPVKSNKWSQYDEPEYRTGGMKRVAYDADSQQYTYRDTNGSLWKSAPGVEYGELTRVSGGNKPRAHKKHSDTSSQSTSTPSTPSSNPERKKTSEFRYNDDNTLTIVTRDKNTGKEEVANVTSPIGGDLEATSGASSDGYSNEGEITHYPRPKDAYKALLPFFLVICAFLLLVIRIFHPALVRPAPPPCPQHSRPYEIVSGDTCWVISKEYGTTVESIRSFNPSLDCATLRPGQHLCVPVKD